MKDIMKKCSRFSLAIIFQLIVIIIWNFVNMYLEKTNDNIDNKATIMIFTLDHRLIEIKIIQKLFIYHLQNFLLKSLKIIL